MIWKRCSKHTRLLVFDAALICIACAAAHALRFYGYIGHRLPYRADGHPLTYGAFAPLLLVIFWALATDHLQVHAALRRRSFPAHMWAVFRAFSWCFIAVALANMLLLVTIFDPPFLALFYPVGLMLLSSAHMLAWLLRKPQREAHVLIVGEGRPAQRAVSALRTLPAGDVQIGGIIGPRPVADVARIGPYDELREKLATVGADTVVLALPAAEHHRMEGLIAALADRHIAVQIVPDLPDHPEPDHCLVDAEAVNGVPFVQIRGHAPGPRPDLGDSTRRKPPHSEEMPRPPAED